MSFDYIIKCSESFLARLIKSNRKPVLRSKFKNKISQKFNLLFFSISVNENELRRIKDAFKRSTGSNGTWLSKSGFLQDVLSEGVPTVLADWLYNACGGTQKGIAFKELLCGLVLLTRGLPDEKIK